MELKDIAYHLPKEVRFISNHAGNEMRIPVITARRAGIPTENVIQIRAEYALTCRADTHPRTIADVIMATIPEPDLSMRYNLIVMCRADSYDDGYACVRWGHTYEQPPQR